jgi:glycosyltransferase involved in cell wall biosynthesis
MPHNVFQSDTKGAVVSACGRDDFDPHAYIAFYPDIAADPDFARSHYLTYGRAEGRYPSEQALESDRQILVDAGIFDEIFYRAAVGSDAASDPIRHYLLYGWKQGIGPAPRFEASFLLPYYQAAEFRGPPAVTYALLLAAGWPVYAMRAEAEAVAHVVRSSSLFDTDSYRNRLGSARRHIDPALHYVVVGERLGIPPSSGFDPLYYLESRPDVGQAKICLLKHYLEYGMNEACRPLPVARDIVFDGTRFAPEKETILLVSHDASDTDAPVIALNIGRSLCKKYNVVTVLLSGGSLVDSFDEISAKLIIVDDKHRKQIELKYIVDAICRNRMVRYAIVNGIGSYDMLTALNEALVPTVALIHEVSFYDLPQQDIAEALGPAMQVVFSTELAANSFRRDNPSVRHRRVRVLPQGHFGLLHTTADPRAEQQRLIAAMRDSPDSFFVLGSGTINVGRGIDLFLASAAAAIRTAGTRCLRFVWIGTQLPDVRAMEYRAYLKEQIARSDLTDHVVLLDDVTDIRPAYEMADVFYFPSRLDSLPNVAIEAAMLGKPIICFQGATGIAEVLLRDRMAGAAVVPYLDMGAAADQIVKLADSKNLREQIGTATRTLAHSTFDPERYIAQIDEIGVEAIIGMLQRRVDLATLLNDSTFDPTTFSSPADAPSTRAAEASRFLGDWPRMLSGPHKRGVLRFRRPCPGFNPKTYAHFHPELAQAGVNPLADFIRKARPEGPWCHAVVRPDRSEAPRDSSRNLRVALHAHFFYPELIEDFLRRIAVNRSRCDLLLSTNEESKAARLRTATQNFSKGSVEIRVVPNKGRNFGPLLTLFGDDILRSYDLVGHLHGKRSFHFAGEGEIWREFLWQHLLGDLYPMMDLILARFVEDEQLGLLFAEDPFLYEWDDNIEIAENLAVRAKLDMPLTPFFDFPTGSMFWARPQALAPLINLRLDWDEYPDEPMPLDGTMLHAIERLFPFAASKEGFNFATSHIPGLTR